MIRRREVITFGAAALTLTAGQANAGLFGDRALARVLAGPQRASDSVTRDGARHPYQSLRFWGLRPHQTVIELVPGGVLGIEEHRAEPGQVQDVLAASGYVQQAYAIQLAREAGFILAGASELNSNPRDTRDHPFGVWTLPPTRLSAPRGQPARPGFDHSKYDAIGESDRMTLKLVKPK